MGTAPKIKQVRYLNQTISNTTTQNSNLPFGNILSIKPAGCLRIFMIYVNGIYKNNSWDDWKQLCTAAKQQSIDALCLTETNLNWNPKLQQIESTLAQKSLKSCHLTTSSHNGPCMGYYQPGGTATAILGNLNVRIAQKITDSTGLGRWSGVKLHTNSKSWLNIITVYHFTRSEGLNTNYMNQMNQLKNNGNTNPDPRKQLIIDLQVIITKFNINQETTLVMIDANDGLFNKASLLPTFLSTTGMIPLLSNPEEYPPTHTRGSQCIDFRFGSSSVLQHIQSSAMNSFFTTPWPNSDHRGLFVDIDIIGLLGASLHDIRTQIPRKVTSKSKKLLSPLSQISLKQRKHRLFYNNYTKYKAIMIGLQVTITF
jgi:hypothetical protein